MGPGGGSRSTHHGHSSRPSREGGQAGTREGTWPALAQLWVRAGEWSVTGQRHQQLGSGYTHHREEAVALRTPRCRQRFTWGRGQANGHTAATSGTAASSSPHPSGSTGPVHNPFPQPHSCSEIIPTHPLLRPPKLSLSLRPKTTEMNSGNPLTEMVAFGRGKGRKNTKLMWALGPSTTLTSSHGQTDRPQP